MEICGISLALNETATNRHLVAHTPDSFISTHTLSPPIEPLDSCSTTLKPGRDVELGIISYAEAALGNPPLKHFLKAYAPCFSRTKLVCSRKETTM